LVSYPYVFSQGNGDLYAFDFHTGELLWKKRISGRMYKGLFNELLIIENAVIRHLSVETGTVLRTLSLPISPKNIILSQNNYVLVNSSEQLFFYDGVSRKIKKIHTDKNWRFLGSFESIFVFYDSKKERVHLNRLSSELKPFYHFQSPKAPTLIAIEDSLDHFALSLNKALYLFNTEKKSFYLLEPSDQSAFSGPLLDIVLDEDSLYLISPSTIDKYLISALTYKTI